jgi:hypothetical protein
MGIAGFFGVGQIAQMVSALVEGDDNLLDQVLSKKLEDLGEDFLMRQLAGPTGGLTDRFVKGIQSGGASEFDRVRRDWMTGKSFGSNSSSKFVNKLFSVLDQNDQSRENKAQSGARWAKSEWARSRSDWLDHHWRHDWRSQPRGAKGRWIPGRLKYIPYGERYQGTKPGRRTLRRRRLRRRSKRLGKQAARKLFKTLQKR